MGAFHTDRGPERVLRLAVKAKRQRDGVMQCPECSHQNTEGAWLCINCGEKLPRPETSETEVSSETAAPDESGRFAPKISENLRRLREQTERERGAAPRRPRDAAPRTPSSTVLGLSLTVWAAVAILIIAFVIVVSNLQ